MESITVPEAAKRLGIQPQSVYKRIRNGKLESYRDNDNQLLVYLPESTQESTQESTDDYRATYIESLEEQISYLKDQLEQEREANKENRRLLARALETHQSIEATESRERHGGTASSSTPAGGHEDSERGTQRQHSLLSRLRDAIRR